MIAQRQTAWGTRVAVDFFLNGTGTGLLLVGSILYFITGEDPFVGRPVILCGLVILLAGLLVLSSELGKPIRMVYSLSNLKSSWLSRGVLFNALLVVTSLVLLFVAPSVPLVVLLLLFSGMTAAYPALLLYAAKDIRLWRTPLVIVVFLFWALAQGAAVITMLLPGHADWLPIPLLAIIALIASMQGILLGRKGAASPFAPGTSLVPPGARSLRWVSRGAAAIGLVVPFILFGVALFTLMPLFSVVGGALLLFGGFLFRYVVLKGAYHEPLSVLHGKDVDKSLFSQREVAAGGDPTR